MAPLPAAVGVGGEPGNKRWIACRLEFRGWHRSPLLQPGRFTELFFLDEATAFAAGHRPCARSAMRTTSASRRRLAPALPRPGRRGRDRRATPPGAGRSGTRRTSATTHGSTGLPDSVRPAGGANPGSCSAPPAPVDAGGLRRAPAARPRRQPSCGDPAPSLIAVVRDGWQSVLPLVHESARSQG